MRLPAVPRAAALLLGATLVLLTSATRFLWTALPPSSALVGNGWPAGPFVGVGDLPSLIEPAGLDGIRVHVLATAATERVTPAGFLARELAAWQRTLARLGAESAAAADADVLVVPHGICLGGAERAVLAAQLERGRGVVTTGALGARDGNCRPLADTLLAHWLGRRGSVAERGPASAGSHYAVVLGGSALGARVPPGARLELKPADQLVFRGEGRDVFYGDWLRSPLPHADEPFFDGAAARSLVGSGRLAAFGFALDHVVPGWSEAIATSLVANAVTWAAGRPVVEIAPWPAAARAAVVFAQDVEHDYANGVPATRLLRAIGVPAASFLLGSEALEHPAESRELAALGEIGTHTVDHRPLDALSLNGQLRQLAWAQRTVEKVQGRPAAGLRPPEERFNVETLLAWSSVGGDYIFAANDARAAAPELVPLGTDTIVLLPRNSTDDFALLVAEQIRDRAELVRRYHAALDATIGYGGLHLFSYHSHLLAQPELLPVLASVAHTVAADSTLWAAQPHEVATWWRARAGVRLEPLASGDDVRVQNRGARPLAGAVLTAHLPDGAARRVAVPRLEPGQSAVVTLRDEAAAAP